MRKLTPQQKIDNAIERMEKQAMSLIAYAEGVDRGGEGFSAQNQRQNLLREARAYARAVDAVRRKRS